jgi:hypothetical protein
MNVGAGQTGTTCWFFSSLNIFLTSDNGLKILWQKLQETLPTLSDRQRAYFNSNINAPCPYKGSVKKTSAIYFWKFLNQYMCAIGGPGRLIPKSGLNAYLTKNIKWRRNSTLESKGTGGGFPSWELPAILGHLGFRVGRDFRMVNYERWWYKFKNNSWTAPILMYSGGSKTFPMKDLLLEKKGYELTGAIVYVKPKPETELMAHVWACTIRNGKGYICDSNFPTTQIQCRWWLKDSLERYFMTVEAPYRTDRSQIMGFDMIMYTRKEFTNKIAPSCQLPKQYRPLTANNELTVREGSVFANLFRKGEGGNLYRGFAPRVRAEIIRRNAARPLMTANVFNKFVNEAGSFNHGMRLLQGASQNYKINKNGQNYKNYTKKLIAKFPRPIPKNMMTHMWRNSGSNKEFANRMRSYANREGYTVNENALKGILARRATTRAGEKRKRNVYRVGNNWFNDKGTNVTNRINKANWVLSESQNKENVKTYRRK